MHTRFAVFSIALVLCGSAFGQCAPPRWRDDPRTASAVSRLDELDGIVRLDRAASGRGPRVEFELTGHILESTDALRRDMATLDRRFDEDEREWIESERRFDRNIRILASIFVSGMVAVAVWAWRNRHNY